MTLKQVSRLAGCSTPVTRAAAGKLFPGQSIYSGVEARQIADLAAEYRRKNMQTYKEKLHERFAREIKQMFPKMIGDAIGGLEQVVTHVLRDDDPADKVLIEGIRLVVERLIAQQAKVIAELQALAQKEQAEAVEAQKAAQQAAVPASEKPPEEAKAEEAPTETPPAEGNVLDFPAPAGA
jgi:mannitol-1-phosphate/altronate dehydrogenase